LIKCTAVLKCNCCTNFFFLASTALSDSLFPGGSTCMQRLGLTLSPPAVKTQWLSQCQAFQRLVRSSHTLVNWTFDLLNRFLISLVCFWKHWMLFVSVCNLNTPGQWKESLGQTSQSLCSSFSGRRNATGAEPRSRIIATSAVKGLS
jgi:hypothetical protein